MQKKTGIKFKIMKIRILSNKNRRYKNNCDNKFLFVIECKVIYKIYNKYCTNIL